MLTARYRHPSDQLEPSALPRSPFMIVGWLSLLLAVIVWAGFALSMRAIGRSPLSTADVALIRFAVPAILLLPLLPSRLARLRIVPWPAATAVATGAGLPFFLLAAAGGRSSSAAHVSALIAGTTPLAVALLAMLLWREVPRRHRLFGLLAIMAGVSFLVAGLSSTGPSEVYGVTLLLAASVLWGAYTLGLRRAKLDPLGCIMLITYPSLLVLLSLRAIGVFETHLSTVSLTDIMPFVVVQGIGVGLLSSYAYSLAVSRLGSTRCATVGALAPVLTTGLAVPLLNEVPSWLSLLGVCVITFGIFVSNATRVSEGRSCSAA
jgi:drug/metabolite transporter (DMT)-like permease